MKHTTKLKKGDKVRLNVQGSQPMEVLEQIGTTVYCYGTYQHFHITKLVKI